QALLNELPGHRPAGKVTHRTATLQVRGELAGAAPHFSKGIFPIRGVANEFGRRHHASSLHRRDSLTLKRPPRQLSSDRVRPAQRRSVGNQNPDCKGMSLRVNRIPANEEPAQTAEGWLSG